MFKRIWVQRVFRIVSPVQASANESDHNPKPSHARVFKRSFSSHVSSMHKFEECVCVNIFMSMHTQSCPERRFTGYACRRLPPHCRRLRPQLPRRLLGRRYPRIETERGRERERERERNRKRKNERDTIKGKEKDRERERKARDT